MSDLCTQCGTRFAGTTCGATGCPGNARGYSASSTPDASAPGTTYPASPYPASPYPAAPQPAFAGEAPVPSGATAAPGYGKAKFVGDAAPVGGIPLSRILNSLCYVIAGIALLVMSGQPGFPGGGSMAVAILLGIGAILYGGKILLTRTSYWVSSWVYILAIGAVAAMFGLLSSH